jgi:prolyl-tRNA editing enzyme YbaK/EbsC (Cys-tRNA(Pro) deacylase)
MADGKPVLAVVAGDRKVDSRKLAKVVGAEKDKLLLFEEAERFS